MTGNGGYVTLTQGPFLFTLELDPNEAYSLLESEPEIAARLAAMMDDWDNETQQNIRGWR